MSIKVKLKLIKVSIKKVKRIAAGKLANAATLMIVAISGNTVVFVGTQPYTLLQVRALIKTYTSAKALYKVSGMLGKPAYTAAKAALIDCMLQFVPYVNDLSNGDKQILAYSTLPTTESLKDIAKLIKEGATAKGIRMMRGIAGQLFVNCTAFGEGVHYIALLSEDVPLMDKFYVNRDGQLVYPAGMTNKVFVDVTSARRKRFSGLTPNKVYYAYYIMVYGDVVSQISIGKKGACAL